MNTLWRKDSASLTLGKVGSDELEEEEDDDDEDEDDDGNDDEAAVTALVAVGC